MTARKPAKPSPRKKVARRPDREPEDSWPAVVRFALENWPRTVRLIVILAVVGGVLLLAMRLGLRLWL